MKKIIVILCFCFSMPLYADDTYIVSDYGVSGLSGPFSCGKILADNDIQEGRQYWRHWLSGFVTGTNLIRKRHGTVDLDGMYAHVIEYCKRNPMDLLMAAFADLDKNLGPGKQRLDIDSRPIK